MLKTDAEKESVLHRSADGVTSGHVMTSAVGGEGEKGVKARQTNSQSEIEVLQQIYEEICAIRHRHAQLIEETAVKKAENQKELGTEKAKYDALEAEHRETGRHLKNLTSGSDEQKAAMVRYRGEQEELENQRKLLDDLEFVMLETDAHYDEQKEAVQQQLMMEQKMLLDVERQHSVRPGLSDDSCHSLVQCTATGNICDKKQTDVTLSAQLKPIICITTCSCEVEQCSCGSGKPSPLAANHELSTSLRLEDGTDQQPDISRCDNDGRHSVLNNRCNCISPRSSDNNDLPSVTSDDSCYASQRMQQQQLQQQQQQHRRLLESGNTFLEPSSFSASYDRSLDSDEWSTASSERQPDRETDVNERIQEIQRLLASAEAERARLLHRPVEEPCDGRAACDVKIKRLQFEEGTDDTPSQQNDIIRRQNIRSQSRPLTRYLPVRDQHLDLLSFVEQAGHYV